MFRKTLVQLKAVLILSHPWWDRFSGNWKMLVILGLVSSLKARRQILSDDLHFTNLVICNLFYFWTKKQDLNETLSKWFPDTSFQKCLVKTQTFLTFGKWEATFMAFEWEKFSMTYFPFIKQQNTWPYFVLFRFVKVN